jgi:ligand-binding sensor domain-containing protein
MAVGVAATLALALAGLQARPVAAAQAMWFENLSLDQGLSQSTVFTIFQDSEGFMWFGTENGLNRYDGYGFKRYERNPHSPDALHDDFIWAAADDSEGNLWFGTDGDGLARWDRAHDKFKAFRHDPADPTSISGNAVRALSRDAHGKLWVGTIGSGVDQLDPATGQVIARYRTTTRIRRASATTRSMRCASMRRAACGSARTAASIGSIPPRARSRAGATTPPIPRA